jgi:acyl carrier protein
MSTIDTVSLRWQRNLPDDANSLRDEGWQPHFNTKFGNIEKWTHHRKGTNLPRFTWSQRENCDGWLSTEFSPPYIVHGTNAIDADNLDIAAVFDLVSDYTSQKSGLDCDSRKALVGRVDYAANFDVGADSIQLYLQAALDAKISRLKPPRRESETAVCVEGKARKIQLYDKHADVLNKIESGRLEGKAADVAFAASFGVLRVESRFKTTQWVSRLAKSFGIERTPESLLNCETAGKVIDMELKRLSLDKPVAPQSARLDSLIEKYGNYKTIVDLFGFLALREKYGDGFYRVPQLRISKATYHRKVNQLKEAGLWLSVDAERGLSALSEVSQVSQRKAA